MPIAPPGIPDFFQYWERSRPTQAAAIVWIGLLVYCLECELNGRSGYHDPGHQHGNHEGSHVNMAGLAVKVGCQERSYGHDWQELESDDRVKRNIGSIIYNPLVFRWFPEQRAAFWWS